MTERSDAFAVGRSRSASHRACFRPVCFWWASLAARSAVTRHRPSDFQRAFFAVAADIKKLMSIEWINDAKTLQKTWLDLLDNRVPASTGLMVSLA